MTTPKELATPPGRPMEWEIWYRDGITVEVGETAFEAHRNASVALPAFGECVVSLIGEVEE